VARADGRDPVAAPVPDRSEGQRLRALPACALGGRRTPSLLVLDEPTDHLDLDAVEAMEGALLAYDGALLVVSHDADFIARIGIDREVGQG
jgi:ATPase subunit of ABC transporter with duplicated ATPase domains